MLKHPKHSLTQQAECISPAAPQAITAHLRRLFAAWVGLCLWLSACQPSVTPQPPPTLTVMTVNASPALQTLTADFSQCAAEQPAIGLVLLQQPVAALQPDEVDLALSWANENFSDSYTAVIGEEELALIVHPQNSLAQISRSSIQKIYSGRQTTWEDGSPIHAMAYPEGTDTQMIFEKLLLDPSPPPELSAPPVLPAPPPMRNTALIPDPAAMREAVAADPAALGFVPKRWVDASVKALSVPDLNPSDLSQPILATSAAEPQGSQKAWLLCLQDQIRLK